VRVRSVEPLNGFTVRLTFVDGTDKVIDLGQYLHGPIFENIRNNSAVFRSVHIVGSTIGWDNGADIDPDVLYCGLTPAWQGSEAAPVNS
jgi:hypothetical protein